MSALNTAEVGGPLIPADVFFQLLDEVLTLVGRAPLNPRGPQRRIITVRPDDRVLQILAGAGSGKTEMLVWRVLFQLFVFGTAANRIVVTTFTRKAATELAVRMVERSDSLLEQARKRGLDPQDPRVHDLRIGTLHSLCDAMLAQWDPDHMAAGTQVVDETEARVRLTRVHRWQLGATGGSPGRVVDRLLAADALIAMFRPPWDSGRWPANVYGRMSFIQAVLAQHTETWIPRCGATATPNGIDAPPGSAVTDDLVKLQKRWEAYLDDQKILDFATIQRRFHERQDAVVPHIDHVFVDEFQDTNPIQLAIHLRWLSRPQTRLTVVGDDDQALYRFRGSDIACFTGLEEDCRTRGIAYRQEKLEQNWRSTKRIVAFSRAFREATVLAAVSMPKTIRSPGAVPVGDPPRLLEGPWTAVCEQVAAEIDVLGAGRRASAAATAQPAIAILLFSTSEKEGRRGGTPALDLRRALEERGLRVYNPRNKTAGRPGSPVHSLAALLSYLIDPVVNAPAGASGRSTMVWASCNDPHKAQFAPVAPPGFAVAPAHAAIQKAFRGSTAGIRNPRPETAPLLTYLDRLRTDLTDATEAHQQSGRQAPRLTLSGVVARLLAFPYFRDVGFTPALFREALFTQLLEANIAPTRRSRSSLDQPLAPTRDAAGKIVWPDEMWTFLNVFATILAETALDDVEDDSFAEHAVALLTFHQAKGLEFDHVYVGLTGREPAPHSVLQTMLFSGQRVPYHVDADGQPVCADPTVAQLALADRERELYVAMTRAKERLTFLHDPADTRPMTALNPGIAGLFAGSPPRAVRGSLTERRWNR